MNTRIINKEQLPPTEKRVLYPFLIILVLTVFLACSERSSVTNKESTGTDTGFSPGLAVGTKIKNFTLTDQTGQPKTLKNLIGPNGAILNFYRSASW
jgi:cytochrome oxidase Cu insertion factor (SCO1/SenC/PrrC family)